MNHFDITQAQPKVWSILSRSFSNKRTASTYLFHGREGLGQWPLAISFAALLNCLKPVKAEETGLIFPCGKCRPCRSIYALNFEGLHFALPISSHKNSDEMIDLTNELLEQKRQEPFKLFLSAQAVTIPIAMAREIKRTLTRKAPKGIRRVVLFYRMEKMKASSADALLKLIEEPPGDTVIILTADRPEALLPTIQSRAQKIRFDRVPEAVAAGYLMSNCGVKENRARLVVRICEGNVGQALEMVSSDEEDDGSSRAVGQLLFRSLFTEPKPEVVALITELIKDRDRGAAESLLGLWQSLIRDCAYYADTGDGDDLVNIDFAEELKRLARFFEKSRLAAAMTDNIKKALADLQVNVHIHISLVALVLKLRSHMPAAEQDRKIAGCERY